MSDASFPTAAESEIKAALLGGSWRERIKSEIVSVDRRLILRRDKGEVSAGASPEPAWCGRMKNNLPLSGEVPPPTTLPDAI